MCVCIGVALTEIAFALPADHGDLRSRYIRNAGKRQMHQWGLCPVPLSRIPALVRGVCCFPCGSSAQ